MGYSFNGDTSIISFTAGTVNVSVRDLYSRWKDWIITTGGMYLPAFNLIGGDPIDIPNGIYITSYFFLINGWKIKPQEANHKLRIYDGVLLTDDGTDPFVQTTGNFNVLVQYSQPVRTETVDTGGGGGGGVVTGFNQNALDEMVAAGNAAGWSGGNGSSTSGDFVNTINTISGIVTSIDSQTSQMNFNGNDILATIDNEKVIVKRNDDKTGYSLSSSSLATLIPSTERPSQFQALEQDSNLFPTTPEVVPVAPAPTKCKHIALKVPVNKIFPTNNNTNSLFPNSEENL